MLLAWAVDDARQALNYRPEPCRQFIASLSTSFRSRRFFVPQASMSAPLRLRLPSDAISSRATRSLDPNSMRPMPSRVSPLGPTCSRCMSSWGVRRGRAAEIRGACSGIVIASCILLIRTGAQLAPEAAPNLAFVAIAAIRFATLALTRVQPLFVILGSAALGILIP